MSCVTGVSRKPRPDVPSRASQASWPGAGGCSSLALHVLMEILPLGLSLSSPRPQLTAWLLSTSCSLVNSCSLCSSSPTRSHGRASPVTEDATAVSRLRGHREQQTWPSPPWLVTVARSVPPTLLDLTSPSACGANTSASESVSSVTP